MALSITWIDVKENVIYVGRRQVLVEREGRISPKIKLIKHNLFDLALVADDVAQALVNGTVEREAVPGGALALLQSER
jgi:hypothetical protein